MAQKRIQNIRLSAATWRPFRPSRYARASAVLWLPIHFTCQPLLRKRRNKGKKKLGIFSREEPKTAQQSGGLVFAYCSLR